MPTNLILAWQPVDTWHESLRGVHQSVAVLTEAGRVIVLNWDSRVGEYYHTTDDAALASTATHWAPIPDRLPDTEGVR